MIYLFAIIAAFLPRVVMLVIFLTTNYFSRAYQTVLWPLLGFFFMPYTTLTYMGAMIMNGHQVSGGWLVLMIIAVFIDLGGQGGMLRL